MKLLRFSPALIIVIVVGIGCDSTTPKKPALPGGHAAHSMVGPNGGLIIDGWGDSHTYHPELVRDNQAKKVTVNIYGGNVKKRVPLDAKKLDLFLDNPTKQIAIVAVPMPGEPKGKSSRFEATDERFESKKKLTGSLVANFEGKNWIGKFNEADKK